MIVRSIKLQIFYLRKNFFLIKGSVLTGDGVNKKTPPRWAWRGEL